VRARVTNIEATRLESDPEYANYLCTLRAELGVVAHADPMVEAVLYVDVMRRDHTHGDDPEVVIISRDILAAPLVVFEVSRDPEGKPTFRCAADYKNESSSQLTAYLLRSRENATGHLFAHYDVLVPVVKVEDLNNPQTHGPLLQSMMALVMVHPVVVKFEITGAPDVTLSFFLFGRGNDGACLFRSAALILQAQELIRPCTAFVVIPRSLPKLNDEETKRCASKQTQKSCVKEIRNTNWSGDKVLESTSITGQMRLEKLLRCVFRELISKTSVCVDVGAGHGNVALYSDYPMLAIECDPLLNVSLKRMYVILCEKHGKNGSNQAVSFLYMNAKDMLSFDGFEMAFLYECHGGTKNGYNDEHKRIVKTLLGSKGLKAFCSTKLQTHCLEGYIEDDAEFVELLSGWVVFKVDGVSRTRCKPMTYVYVRKEQLYPTCNPGVREVSPFNDRLIQNALHNGDSTGLWTVRLAKNGREVSTSQNELRITIGDLVITDSLTSCVITTGDAVSSQVQSGVVIGLACTMPLPNMNPFKLVVVVSVDPFQFELLDQLEILKIDSINRHTISDEQIKQCKAHFKTNVLKVSQQRSSSRHVKKMSFVTPAQKRGNESDSNSDEPPNGQVVEPTQFSTQEILDGQAKAQEILDNQAKAQEKLERQIDSGRLRLQKTAKMFKQVQAGNKTARQKLKRENEKKIPELDSTESLECAEDGLLDSDTSDLTEAPTITRSKRGESELRPFTRSKQKHAVDGVASNSEIIDVLAPNPIMSDVLASNHKIMSDLLASNLKMMSELVKTKPVKESVEVPSVNEMRIQSLLLEATTKFDNAALSIQRQIDNKSKDVKAKEKKRERKASDAKTQAMQKEYLEMQLAFQKKISEDLAAQNNRSKLEKGLKKMKLLLETTKTVNAEQGKHAFEVQVKRLELAQEQARADARADARWLNGGCTKRQRSRSARFHFALFLFCLTTSGTNKHLNHISRSPRQNKSSNSKQHGYSFHFTVSDNYLEYVHNSIYTLPVPGSRLRLLMSLDLSLQVQRLSPRARVIGTENR
jgi:uncharacterized coiled-coil protein SlyX